MTCVGRKSAVPTWFVCPMLTLINFWYIAYVDEQTPFITRDYTMLMASSVSVFLVAIFNEVWLISLSFYAPCLGYIMWKEGAEYEGIEFRDISVRALFCIIFYAITAFQLERAKKRVYLFSQSGTDSFDRWSSVFNTFSEGIAIVRENEVTFKNVSFLNLFRQQLEKVGVYREEADPQLLLLKDWQSF